MLTLNNSLYFISRHFKQFSVPKVVMSEHYMSVGGWYDWNVKCIICIDDQEIYNENGIIVIANDIICPVENLILHEYRHHLQFNLHGYWPVPDYPNGESLDDYNKNCIFEIDARLSSTSLGLDDWCSDYWKINKTSRHNALQLPTTSYLTRLNKSTG